MVRLAALALGAAAAGCSTLAPEPPPPSLARAHFAADFDTYEIARVGLMPVSGDALSPGEALAVGAAFQAELSGSTPFEIVALSPEDLAEVRASDPHRRGWYAPETIVALSRRYLLDAILFPTVTRSRFWPPQELSVQLDLVSSETGMVVWSSSVHLDAADERVREGLRHFYREGIDREGEEWRVALLSPARFARFAAHEIARLL